MIQILAIICCIYQQLNNNTNTGTFIRTCFIVIRQVATRSVMVFLGRSRTRIIIVVGLVDGERQTIDLSDFIALSGLLILMYAVSTKTKQIVRFYCVTLHSAVLTVVVCASVRLSQCT